jgi:hypothetical protein
MLWDQCRRWRIVGGKKRYFDAPKVSVKVLYSGPRATDDAGPGSGGGSKVRILRQDTGEETSVYARNLKQKARRPIRG